MNARLKAAFETNGIPYDPRLDALPPSVQEATAAYWERRLTEDLATEPRESLTDLLRSMSGFTQHNNPVNARRAERDGCLDLSE